MKDKSQIEAGLERSLRKQVTVPRPNLVATVREQIGQ